MITILVMMILSSTSLSDFDTHKLIPEIAVANCKNLKRASDSRKESALKIAYILYDVEEEMGIPNEMRGMTLSAACLESAFNPNAKGDRNFSKNKKTPRAIGVLQMWKIYEKVYGTDRKDPRSSAIGWLTHIKKKIPKVKRQCKYKSVRKVWIAAWVTGIRYKKPGGRCKEKPLHLRYFMKIRRLYDSQIKISETKSGSNSLSIEQSAPKK